MIAIGGDIVAGLSSFSILAGGAGGMVGGIRHGAMILYYDYYAYDQPIYGYDGLPPDQVVANVQSALQQLGYYSYSVDGTMGPLTRAAIANFQRDHLLPITGDIDPATLGSLGLTY